MAKAAQLVKRIVIGDYLLEYYDCGDLHIEDGDLLDGAGYPIVFVFDEGEVEELKAFLSDNLNYRLKDE